MMKITDNIAGDFMNRNNDRQESLKPESGNSVMSQNRMPAGMPADTIASPDPALQFVFAMFAILTCLSKILNLTADARFVMGVLQLSLGVAALTGSRLNLKRGDPHGNINLVLSVILGFASGLTQISGVFASMAHLHFHPWVLSVILLMGGIYMLAMLPLMNRAPAYVWFEHLSVSLGFLSGAFGDLLAQPVLSHISGWLLFCFALLALYQGVSEMYGLYGRKLPQGRSLF